MAITSALSPLDINLAPPGGGGSNTRAAPTSASSEIKRTTTGQQPRKQSDYHLIQKLTTAKVGSTKVGAIDSGSSAQREERPLPASHRVAAPSKTPVKRASARASKKILCATPPVNLRNKKRGVDYDRGRQLGEGGFARCFLVQNKEGKLFAAKTVAKESLQSEKMQAKFFGEIQVQKTMVHPNIVRFVECFEDTRNIYLILELCPNKTLVEMLRRRGRMTEPEAKFFMLQTLGALKYMHGKRVIHRDLKLGNIFLDEGMNIKIGDFGLAALLVSDTDRKTTMCGTPNYIAPEVLFGKKVGHSFEVDLWSCGVILYAMLVGKPPFQAADINEIYKKIRDSNFDWPIDVSISSHAKALVSALLSKDPNNRPSLDTIADHPFFRQGYFPRSIPTSATTKEPIWKTASGSIIINNALSSTAKAESRRNYMEVARNAGIGIDESGAPMPCVGDDVGRPVSALEIEMSTGTTTRNQASTAAMNAAPPARSRQRRGDMPPPSSSAAMSGSNGSARDSAASSAAAARLPSARERAKQNHQQRMDEVEEFVMKVMDPVVIVESRAPIRPSRETLSSRQPAAQQQQQQQQEQKQLDPADYLSPKQSKKKDFLLPEALSPRDGRARMRGTALLRGPSGTAPARRPSGLNPARSGVTTDLTAAPGIAPQQRRTRLGQQREVLVEEVELVEDDENVDDIEEEEEEEALPPPPPPPQRVSRRPRAAAAAAAAAAVTSAAVSAALGATAGIASTKGMQDVVPPRRGTTRSSVASATVAAESRGTERPVPSSRRERERERERERDREPEPRITIRNQEPAPAPSSRRGTASASATSSSTSTAPTTRRTMAVRTASSSTAAPTVPPTSSTTTTTTSAAQTSSYARTSTNLSAISTGSNPSSSSTPIPNYPVLTNTHGTPHLHTTTSNILSSLPSYVTSLTSILSASPPPPANSPETARQVRDWKDGKGNRCVFITKWVDYTNKYGIGYTLTDGSCGTMFNDNTGLVCEDGDANGDGKVWYLSQGHAPVTTTSAATAARRSVRGQIVTETVYNCLETTLGQLHKERAMAATMRRYGGKLGGAGNGLNVLVKIANVDLAAGGDTRLAENKVSMWKRFGTYMRDSLEGGNENDFVPEKEAVGGNSAAAGFGNGKARELAYITNYARLPQGAFFRFANGDVQFNFADHTKLVLSDGGKTLRFVGKGRKMYVMGCMDVWRILMGGLGSGLTRWEVEVREGGIRDKISFARGFLRAWWREGKIPGLRKMVGQGSGGAGGEGNGGGGSGGTSGEEVVVLGEAVITMMDVGDV